MLKNTTVRGGTAMTEKQPAHVRSRTSIAKVSERDIDLLLLEEFLSTPVFLDWFVTTALGLPSRPLRCVQVRYSVDEGMGESDIVVDYEAAEGVVQLLIENKVGAGLQPQQAARYRNRSKAFIKQNEGVHVSCHTVIVAPSRYFSSASSTKGFDKRVDYELMREWFSKAECIGARRFYKEDLLDAAIEKGTKGYQPVEDDDNSKFWLSYWKEACGYTPTLEMKQPRKEKPSRSAFIYFRPPSLPLGVEICHKFRAGAVVLQLSGMARRLNEVRAAFGDAWLDEPGRLTFAGKSAAVRVEVPILNVQVPFADQLADVRAGLDAAMKLHDWVLAHKDSLLVLGFKERRSR